MIQKIRSWSLKTKILVAVGLVLVVAVVAKVKAGARAKAQATLTEPIKRGMIMESVYGIGTVAATRSYSLKTGVVSTVRQLFVKEGDTVRKGQGLVALDGPTPVPAPFDGTVTYVGPKVGETVFAQATVLVVTDLKDRYITVSLEQRGVIRVRPGQKARISFDSLRDQNFEGKVEAAYSNDGNFLVRIGVAGLPPQILPGMTADVAIGIAERQNALLIPVSALSADKVQVRRGSSSEQVAVKLGVVDGSQAEVLSGDIKEGDVLEIVKKGPGK